MDSDWKIDSEHNVGQARNRLCISSLRSLLLIRFLPLIFESSKPHFPSLLSLALSHTELQPLKWKTPK
ncbi:hypothetical protein CEXT_225811 [Caerostris extrusa]|uniref:Uncharacterized protein n=1 Tax=Caerostris extrusa TaxID=172846 RepID=A0AAV4RIW0_CAEEX|nr:hypothetical protein CEXT_225811 [Caerostris extrusa]